MLNPSYFDYTGAPLGVQGTRGTQVTQVHSNHINRAYRGSQEVKGVWGRGLKLCGSRKDTTPILR